MDDRYREGFERLLSDMDDPPSWEQISTQHATPAPVPTRGRGLLVAAAAFAVTIVAIGAVVLALASGSEPVAAPIEDTVAYVEISWDRDIDFQCGDLQTVDNGGYDHAKVEVWGPNADDLLRVDVTAPDGSIDRLITTFDPSESNSERVWYGYEGPDVARSDRVYRVAECVSKGPTVTHVYYGPTQPPVGTSGHPYAGFVAFPTAYPGGEPWDFEASLSGIGTTREDEWRGIPVTVYTEMSTGSVQRYVSEHWVDSKARRYERLVQSSSDERYGTITESIAVVKRAAVPLDSVSFSVDGMILTLDTTSDGVNAAPTTTAAPLSTDSRWTDGQVSDTARIWVNQVGLNQGDPDVWRSRLDRICDIGPATGDADTAMSTLAAEFIAEDAALSVRADGDLPTSAEAVESLWTIAISPVCLETSLTGTTVPDVVNVADFDDVDSVDAEINRRHALIDEIMTKRDDAERKIRDNQEILAALEAQTDPPASQQVIERQRVIVRVAELEREQAEETLTRIEAIMADLQARHAELVDIVEAHMAEDRVAAQERATQHAPYLVEDPIGLEPPSALPGNGGASGSGCYPGPGDLPDGIWFGYLLDRDGPTIDFDLDCMYFGEAARAFAGESDTDADDDIVFVKFDAVVRTLPVAATATVWMITGDATEGHQALSFDREWTGDESTYASCPGEGCPIWIYVNDGIVDAIVQQYLP